MKTLFLLPRFEGDTGAAPGGAPAGDVATAPTPSGVSAGIEALAVPEGMKRNRSGTLSPDPNYKPATEAAPVEARGPASDAPKVEAPKPDGSKVETPTAEPAAAAVEPEPAYDTATLMGELKREVIGLPVSDPKELPAYVRDLQTGAELSGEIRAMAGESPEFASFLTLVAQGKSIDVAAREAFARVADVPDPADDPEGYQRWADRQAEKRAQTQLSKQQEADEQAKAKALGQQVRKSFDAHTQRMASVEGYDDAAFRKDAQSVLYGDPTTGRYRGDAPDILYRGLNHDTLVKQAVDTAVAQARETLLNEVRAGQHSPQAHAEADLPPPLGGGGLGAGVDLGSLSPDDQAAYRFANGLGLGDTRQKNRSGTYTIRS